MAAHRLRDRGPVVAEVHFGSANTANTRSRASEHSWMVMLFRSNQALIVAIGLTKDSAQRLTDQLNAFLN